VFSGGIPGAIFTRIVGVPDLTGVSSSTDTWTLPCSSRNSCRTTAYDVASRTVPIAMKMVAYHAVRRRRMDGRGRRTMAQLRR
jgi:hypothetical protein